MNYLKRMMYGAVNTFSQYSDSDACILFSSGRVPTYLCFALLQGGAPILLHVQRSLQIAHITLSFVCHVHEPHELFRGLLIFS